MPDEPPAKTPIENWLGLKWSAIFLAVVLVFAVLVTAPMVKSQRIKAHQTSSISNLRQIGLSLYEFESDYGRFPDNLTAAEIKRKSLTLLSLSDRTSNDVFVQLLASGIAVSEVPFGTHTSETRKPDDDWSSDATAMEAGETGFAFISGLSAKDNPSLPIVFGPVVPGTRAVDADAFDHKAVVLKMDNSVASFSINSKGLVPFKG
ncbi:MAG: hypothetical protein EOP85_06025, partial [Verrucomicrobiaceae bacterium]